MKKLILSLTAALAIGAYADTGDYSYTGFDALTAGTAFNPNLDDLGGTTASYWEVVKEGDEYGVISNHTETCQVAGLDGYANYLKVETDGTIMRYAIDREQAQRKVDVRAKPGIYFDSLVQFTGADEIPASDVDDTKLAVWLYKSDTEDGAFGIGTNLVVTAAYLDNAANHVTPSNYVVSAAGISEGWHRLTVKMIPEIGSASGVAGFVVFIDGVAVTNSESKGVAESVFGSLNATAAKWNGENALFPTMVTKGDEKQTFTYVGFKGQGAIDELKITENAPKFAADGTIFTLNWDAGLASLTIDGEPVDSFVAGEEGTTNINVAAGTPTYEVIATPKAGYNLGERVAEGGVVKSGDNGFTVNGTGIGTIVVNQAKFIVNGQPYATFEEAIEAAGSGDTVMLGANIDEPISLDEANIVLDLAGHNIATSTEEGSDPAIMVNGSATMILIDSIGGGKISGGADDGCVTADGPLTIGQVEGDAGVAIDGYAVGNLSIVRGNFLVEANDEDELSEALAEDTTMTQIGDYYVATPGGEPPAPTTYDVKFSKNEVQVGEAVKVEEGKKLAAEQIPEFEGGAWDVDPATAVITCNTNFNYTIVEPVTKWTVTFSTNDVAVAEAETEVEDGNTLSEGQIPAFTGGAWDVDPTGAVITCDTNFNYTISSGKTYPDYIPTGDEDVKTKFDKWVDEVNDGDRDISSDEMDAFLLNVKPADVETAKAAFKITSITQDEDGNWIVKACDKVDGEAYLNGFVNIVPYTLTGAGEGAEFWQATLTVEPANNK